MESKSQDLLDLLQAKVEPGEVTTYGNCSTGVFRHRKGGPAVATMLEALAKEGYALWTNRVVSDDGTLQAAAQAHGQLDQLRAEGVPFIGPLQVDLARCPPIIL